MVCAVLALAGCCDVEAEVRALAGDGAIDCGFAPLTPAEGEPTRADVLDCGEAAQADGVPFYLGYAVLGEDTEVRQYRTRDANGRGWMVAYDGPLGGSGGPRVEAWECVGDFDRGLDGLTCSTRTTAPTRVICSR
jgi:hypothetical protein